MYIEINIIVDHYCNHTITYGTVYKTPKSGQKQNKNYTDNETTTRSYGCCSKPKGFHALLFRFCARPCDFFRFPRFLAKS